MDDKTKLVLNGFVNLDDDQRTELINEMNEWLKLNSVQKSSSKYGIKEAVQKIDLGPLSKSCPCCGR